METRLKSLESEWQDTYDKLSALAGRMDRARRIAPGGRPAASTPQEALFERLLKGQADGDSGYPG